MPRRDFHGGCIYRGVDQRITALFLRTIAYIKSYIEHSSPFHYYYISYKYYHTLNQVAKNPKHLRKVDSAPKRPLHLTHTRAILITSRISLSRATPSQTLRIYTPLRGSAHAEPSLPFVPPHYSLSLPPPKK